MAGESIPELYEAAQTAASLLHRDPFITVAMRFKEAEGHEFDPSTFLCSLGLALQDRYTERGFKEDLDMAISAHASAVKVCSKQFGMCLNNYGSALWIRSIDTKSKDDLNAAVRACEEAYKCTPPEHPNKAIYLSNFITVISDQTVVDESLQSINKAIEYTSLAAASPDTPQGRFILTTLSRCYLKRCEYTYRLEDVNNAIAISSNLVNYFSEDTLRAYILGRSLQLRYHRTGYRRDLMRSIEAFEQSITCGRDKIRNRSAYVIHYTSALLNRYDRTGFMADLLKAIELLEGTITPEEPNRHALLARLGSALVKRFHRTDSPEDLNEAIDAFQSSVNLSRDSEKLISLGDILSRRSRLNRRKLDIDDLNRAVAAYDEAASEPGPPARRIMAALSAALLLEIRDPTRASEFASLAVELLPEASPVTVDRDFQQDTLSSFSGLAVTAAALALTVGDGQFEAIRLLELGRGVIASLQLDLRTDLKALRTSQSFREAQFKHVKERFASVEIKQKKSNQAQKERFHAPKGTRLISDGIALLDPAIAAMMAQAKHGPIVVFNVSHSRSDALLIAEGKYGVHSLVLPGLHHQVLKEKVVNLTIAIDNLSPVTYRTTRNLMKGVLEWLWDVAVGPVLHELGFLGNYSNVKLPHIWWIASGLLNLLPIHAAGYHDGGSTNNVLDRAISSYTPTIKCLAYSRLQAANMSYWKEVEQKALLVGMPETPGQADLPYVEEEMRCLQNILPIQHTTLERPTKATVLSELQQCQIVHFACHGESTVSDPSRSRLFLMDEPLTVTDIIALKLKDPQFAFLSACHAANNRVLDLLDEGIHLTGACQLAGFPFVVGTLWQLDDEKSVQLTNEVYSAMVENGKRVAIARSAVALHNAISKLRAETKRENRGIDDPLIWATYIHVGA